MNLIFKFIDFDSGQKIQRPNSVCPAEIEYGRFVQKENEFLKRKLDFKFKKNRIEKVEILE